MIFRDASRGETPEARRCAVLKTVGLVISRKNNEKRRALLPREAALLEHPECFAVEEGYGLALGHTDDAYREAGVAVLPRADVVTRDILVDVKMNETDVLDQVEPGRILFGWAHAVQSLDFTTKVIEGKHTVFAWEELYEGGRYLFFRNREIAGAAGVLHAFTYYGSLPSDTRVAILGNGQTARGAMRVLYGLGARVDVYDYMHEELFRRKMFQYDVIVNCVLWDTSRDDRLIYRSDLKHFRPGSMIIDISCDPNLEIETSRPTSFDDPVYTVDGVLHYCVDNTPAMFSKSVSHHLSEQLVPYYNQLVTGAYSDTLKASCIIKDGVILRDEITAFRAKHLR